MLRDRGRRAMVIATPLAIALLGCAGPVKVKPRVPTAPPLDDRQARVSLYLDAAITGALVVSTAPTGDIGLGDVTVTFEVGEPLSETVAGAARSVFLAVLPVATPTCAPNTVGVLEVTLPTPPYAQVHWRGETPHVGGGTVAELLVRVIYRDCAGTERGRAVAYGFGDAQHGQAAANWPDAEDFEGGMTQALDHLRVNLVDLFRALGTLGSQS